MQITLTYERADVEEILDGYRHRRDSAVPNDFGVAALKRFTQMCATLIPGVDLNKLDDAEEAIAALLAHADASAPR